MKKVSVFALTVVLSLFLVSPVFAEGYSNNMGGTTNYGNTTRAYDTRSYDWGWLGLLGLFGLAGLRNRSREREK